MVIQYRNILFPRNICKKYMLEYSMLLEYHMNILEDKTYNLELLKMKNRLCVIREQNDAS